MRSNKSGFAGVWTKNASSPCKLISKSNTYSMRSVAVCPVRCGLVLFGLVCSGPVPSNIHVLLRGGIDFFGISHVDCMLLIDGGCVSTASDNFLSHSGYDLANLASLASGRRMKVFHTNSNTNQAHIRSGPVGCGLSGPVRCGPVRSGAVREEFSNLA